MPKAAAVVTDVVSIALNAERKAEVKRSTGGLAVFCIGWSTPQLLAVWDFTTQPGSTFSAVTAQPSANSVKGMLLSVWGSVAQLLFCSRVTAVDLARMHRARESAW